MGKPAIVRVPLLLMLASAASLFLGFWVLRSALAGFLLYYLLCCLLLPALDVLVLRRVPLRLLPASLGLRRLSRRELGLGLGSGLLMSAAMLAALALFRGLVFGDGRIRETLAGWGVSGRNLVLVYLVMLAFNGVVEELFWRGFLHGRLAALPSRLLALGLPALLFASQHLFVLSRLVADPALVALFLAGIFGAGLVWGLLRERSGSVVPCALSHALVTASYMGAFFFFTR
jgi:uncharacterized protein